jgi:hypothetical protein
METLFMLTGYAGNIVYVYFKILKAVIVHYMIFWNMTPYILVGAYQLFGDTHCFHLQG